MFVDPNELLEICCRFLDEYKTFSSPEAYLDEVKLKKNLGKEDYRYISDVCFGCLDNKTVLNPVVDGFYSKDGKNVLKSERSLYIVMSYIIIYRVRHYGMNEMNVFSNFVRQQKIFKFLKFFLNEKNLLTWMKDAWSTQFEMDHVQSELLNPILNLLPDLKAFLEDLENHIFENKKTLKKSTLTSLEPFNLTEPAKRKLLLPEKISSFKFSVNEKPSQMSNDSEIPNTKSIHHFSTKSSTNLSKLKVNSKEKIKEEKGSQAAKTTMTSSTNSSKPKSTESYFIKKQESSTFKSKPFNYVENENDPIKLNTAVILKDEFIIKKQMEELISKLTSLENGEGNSNEFAKWQYEAKMNDLKQKQLEIERRKIQSKISYEEAILAKANLTETNKQKAKQIIEEKTRLLNELEEKNKELAEKRAQLVKETIEKEKSIKHIRTDIEMNKKTAAEQIKRETEEMKAKALKEIEEDMKKKIELIQQIKAIESLPNERTKHIDLTSTANHGLLSEMSIVELRERLDILKKKELDEHRVKHDSIVDGKIRRNEQLVEKLFYINKYRNENLKAVKSKEIKRNEMSLPDNLSKSTTLTPSNDDSLVKLQDKLSKLKEKRTETMNKSNTCPNELAEMKAQFNTYHNQRKLLEMNRFRDLERAKEKPFLNEALKLNNL